MALTLNLTIIRDNTSKQVFFLLEYFLLFVSSVTYIRKKAS